jgi:hypothetical protein
LPGLALLQLPTQVSGQSLIRLARHSSRS